MTFLSAAHPLALAALLAAAAGYLVACARWGAPSALRQAGFAMGWLAALGAFAVPAAQLAILSGIAAPLMAIGLSPRMLSRLAGGSATAAAGILALTLWYWHVPGPLALAGAGGAGEAAMLLSLLGASLNLWRALLSRPDRLAAVLVTGAQLAALGAWQGDLALATFGGLLLVAAAALAAMPLAPARQVKT